MVDMALRPLCLTPLPRHMSTSLSPPPLSHLSPSPTKVHFDLCLDRRTNKRIARHIHLTDEVRALYRRMISPYLVCI